jgi:hypothetical protein
VCSSDLYELALEALAQRLGTLKEA